ncbi:glycolate oxidase subunit GlcE [soil metagenome]
MQQVLNQFKDRIAAASASKAALRLRGGGSKDWYGQSLKGDPFDTRDYHGIIDYDPTELVITARCGTTLDEIEAALAQHRQMLAFEPPHFAATSTIGGAVAAGLSGPRRQAAGALRDFVLGVTLMGGRGEVLHFGGRVMKNVAGYDVSRLLAGSMGTLGVILEVSLKVLPKPSSESSLRFMMNEAKAIDTLNRWSALPLPISASAWQDGMLMVRLSGAEAAVSAAQEKMGGDKVHDADLFWNALREQKSNFFAPERHNGTCLWRLSVPSATLPLDLPGAQLIEWGGAQRWFRTEAPVEAIRAAADKFGGHACLFRGGDKCAGVFHPLRPTVAKIHRNLKTAFDPNGIFNPGRMYADF